MQLTELKKIGDVAELLKTTPRTLRFYEEEGLVTAHRTPKGTRLYSETDIARFKAILHLAQSGIPINLIKQLAIVRTLHPTGDESRQHVQTILGTLTEQVSLQMDALQKLQSELTFAAEIVQACSQCNNPPTRMGCPDCPIHQKLDVSNMLNLIWEQEIH
ncbi:MerR family transcriptional regulator [Candidatus Albibeggiatoa sp. nov. BB20]|uniref:MerR family transcriptional regulator n=1 Tax=Candidatus Albibeggiatoa sp. nov. BB20 TaxID=3162723 RepID=UPI0033657980